MRTKAFFRLILALILVLSFSSCRVPSIEPVPPIPTPPQPLPPEELYPLPPVPPFLGASAYGLIRYDLADIENFILGIKQAGGNMTEVFLCFAWNDGWRWSPYKQIGWRKEGKKKFPYFDLDEWNEEVWAKWREVFEICRKYGIALFVRLLDYGSYDDNSLKDSYVWYSCKQRFEAKPQLPHFWQNAARSKPYLKALALKTKQELDAAGIVYKIVPVNEHWSRAKDPERAQERALEIHGWWVEIFKDIGLCPNQVMLNPAVTGIERHLQVYGLEFEIEVHRVNSDVSLKKAIDLARKYSARIFANGDGTDKKAKGRADDNGRREPSLEQAKDMAKMLKEADIDYGYKVRHKLPAGETCYICNTNFDVLLVLSSLGSL